MKNRIKTFYNVVIKRFIDILSSFILIFILSPFILIVTLLNCFFTKFNPIFVQKRCGRNGKPFFLIKFRTLRTDCPSYQEKSSSYYYTKIGFFLRKSHIDEILQLFNIFVGHMSFIGPRPIILSLNEQIEQRRKDGTLALRPGLSGLAQINEVDYPLSQMEKCEFDKKYLENLSFATDFKILFSTMPVIVMNLFRGKNNG